MLGVLLAGFAALQIGDGVSTVIALRNPALAEGNPVARAVFARIGVLPAVAAMKLLAIALAVALAASTVPSLIKLLVLGAACAGYGWAVADNIRLVRVHGGQLRGYRWLGGISYPEATAVALALLGVASVSYYALCAFMLLEPCA